ncbi:oxidoreductase [Aurantibacter crassamenti]|uniref:PDR/VanB family oxidoreductase n=1 Tax=Aurantibacter crassamenti TaxID=1837375 RepID=UPI0019396236|nr:PDR/VanB family oxidoreductase [Aurantibacter crassamenti]MBM1107335.1 oxidoreductase [Aurantibacter crassamenti]
MRYRNSWIDATVVAIEQVAKSVMQIQILPLNGATECYTVGSHIDVSVLIDGKTEIRSYSLVGEYESNTPYIIAVKLLPSSKGGSKYMWSLAAGNKIRISQPTNNFELSHNTNDYLLIAAGIGITPIIGMAKTLKRKTGLTVKMLYAGNNKKEMPFLEELQSLLGVDLMLHYSDAQGFYNTTKLIDLASAKTQIYLCGPLPFMNAVRKTWEDGPFENSNLRFETFGASGLFAPQDFLVKIPRFDLQIKVKKNKTILQALEDAHIDVMYDCKKGECGLCQVDILEYSGDIDHRDFFFSESEKGENDKLCACVSRVANGSITIDTSYRGV